MRRLTAGVLFLSLSYLVQADEDPAQWLSRMSQSLRELDYRGIVTYQVGEQLSSFRVSHIVNEGREFDSLEPLDSKNVAMVRQGHELHCTHPGGRLLKLLSSAENEAGIGRVYTLEFVGRGRQAGRETVELLVRPKDVYRYGYRLFLDAETGLLLRNDILSRQGTPLERFQFVLLELGEFEPDSPSTNARPASPFHGNDNQVNASVADWRPGWLPAGFTASDSVTGNQAKSYTDGLAAFTVFVDTPPAGQQSTDGGMQRGASVSFEQRFPDREARVTVVGEVPLLTAREIAKSVVWREP